MALKYNKHVIIVGTARSGTSWLSETIALQHRYRMLFEPEQETRTKLGYLLCDLWLENPSESLKANDYLKQVFANRVDCDWIAQNSNRKYKMHLWPFIPKMFIIKFVRANLSAHFMNHYFGIPVIHMIRNPYEVLDSQMRVNFPWLADLSRFASQPKLVSLVKQQFGIDLSNLSNYSKLQLLALRWCIENVIPLEVWPPYNKKHKVIRYEDLFTDIQVFYQLCNEFKLEPIKSIDTIYTRPSSKTHSLSTIITEKEQRLNFSNSELQSIGAILEAFNTKLYPIL